MVEVISSEDEMGGQLDQDTPKGPSGKRCRIEIQLSEDPKPPVARFCTLNSKHQLTFADLGWVPKVLDTQEEKEAEWKKQTERFRAEAKLDKDKYEAEAREKLVRKRELVRERVRRFHNRNSKSAKPKRSINNVSISRKLY